MAQDDTIGEALGLPEPVTRDFRPIVIPETPKDDHERARQNLYEVMTRNADALEEAVQMAAIAQHPRAFEVISLLVKAGLEASRDLADLEKRRLETEKLKGDAAKVINGSDTEMSSTDILHSLKGS